MSRPPLCVWRSKRRSSRISGVRLGIEIKPRVKKGRASRYRSDFDFSDGSYRILHSSKADDPFSAVSISRDRTEPELFQQRAIFTNDRWVEWRPARSDYVSNKSRTSP